MDNDSRQYRYPYLIRIKDDIPTDFGGTLPAFRNGLFLPRDDPDWFGRSAYAPRIVLLTPGALYIYVHPAARDGPSEIPVDECLTIESGHALLMGWLTFRGRKADRTLPYNTRINRPVHEFLRALLAEFPVPRQSSDFPRLAPLGEPLNLKFRNALADELNPGEEILTSFFNPAREEKRGLWFLSWKRWTPADLVVLTSRRVLWITDRHHGEHLMYGSVCHSAPIGGIAGVGLLPAMDPAIESCGCDSVPPRFGIFRIRANWKALSMSLRLPWRAFSNR